MVDLKKYPTLDLAVRKVPPTSSVDADGKPICVWCRKRLRFRFGWGYNGSGHFCGMKCAAEWGDTKVEGTCEDYEGQLAEGHSHT
jgi:hypothetical protein